MTLDNAIQLSVYKPKSLNPSQYSETRRFTSVCDESIVSRKDFFYLSKLTEKSVLLLFAV